MTPPLDQMSVGERKEGRNMRKCIKQTEATEKKWMKEKYREIEERRQKPSVFDFQ